MHGYPVMQVVQYHIPPAMVPPHCTPHLPHTASPPSGGIRKYVFWCCACGGLATILGALFLAVYFLLRSYTSTLGYFETIPTFVPATMLILTGLCVISLARRKNRYSYLIKVCGLCCLVCALTCVLVTITTTVIHMNRLQTLRECVYTQKTRTCTCYSVLLEAHANADDGRLSVFLDNSLTYQGAASSADSQYGFSNRSGENPVPSDQISGSTGSYSMLDNRPPLGGVYVWGPPPPYSNPNSPARRYMHQSPARYHHMHHHPHGHESHCQMNENNQFRSSRRARAHTGSKDNYENTTEPEIHQTNENSESTDTSSCVERVTHTLPVRKIKKRTGNEIASVKSANQPPNHRGTAVQGVFGQGGPEETHQEQEENDYHEPNVPENNKPVAGEQQQPRFLPRLQGVENAAFQKQEPSPQKPETTESEVYFADVSSCCHSVRNDGQDSSLYDEAMESNQKSARLISLQKPVETKEEKKPQPPEMPQSEEEDYLAQRMANRQMSTRSRMPFPLPNSDDLEFNSDSCLQLLPKDMSQNSLCSSVQTPMTETTDDTISPEECCPKNYIQESVDAMPIHRGFAGATMDQFLAPDAQYEVIPENDGFRNSSNLANTISGVNYDQNYYNQGKGSYNFANSPKGFPPKSLNLNQPNRRNIGSNISALIQNLGGNLTGLLYGEGNAEEEVQVQGCHSDGTMDSGWQSGSEKAEARNKGDGIGEPQRPVNI
ncbi:hypothetical protein GWI33_017396 [Rhynchophorus ferrugineus]|uniref:Uncharacterized protein n=1 Tax=Rhynchophorus ferrugineus TaxID=354439 RepID=A0A834IRW9_RHYFE|nr:hypothetical protein GWI33_017396 [Rhynchophorus ferrugineus]